MAFGNYIAAGTYTVVDKVSYSRRDKHLQWQIQIYDGSAKANLLAVRDLIVTGSSPIQRLVDTCNVEPPVDQRSIGDIWAIGSDPEGVWQDREGHLAKWTGRGWEYWLVAVGQQFYHVATKKYIVALHDMTYVPFECWHDYWTWEEWFTADKMLVESNVVKQIYLYLKETKEAFSNCTNI